MKLAKLAKHQPQNIFFQINNRNLEFVVQLPGWLFFAIPKQRGVFAWQHAKQLVQLQQIRLCGAKVIQCHGLKR